MKMGDASPDQDIPGQPLLSELRNPKGDLYPQAWSQAYPHLWDAAWTVANRLLVGAEHLQNREDVAARTLAQVMRGLLEGKPPSFNQLGTFSDLLGMTRRIAISRVRDFYRRRYRQSEELRDDWAVLMEHEVSPAPPPPLTSDECARAISELPPPQAEILHEHYVLGRTAAEIAAARGCPRGTVLSHLHRGKLRLRQRLLGEKPAGTDDAAPQ